MGCDLCEWRDKRDNLAWFVVVQYKRKLADREGITIASCIPMSKWSKQFFSNHANKTCLYWKLKQKKHHVCSHNSSISLHAFKHIKNCANNSIFSIFWTGDLDIKFKSSIFQSFIVDSCVHANIYCYCSSSIKNVCMSKDWFTCTLWMWVHMKTTQFFTNWYFSMTFLVWLIYSSLKEILWDYQIGSAMIEQAATILLMKTSQNKLFFK